MSINHRIDRKKEAHAKHIQKNHKHIFYSIGDEVLLYNARKKGHKGGPYTIKTISGKLVTLMSKEAAGIHSEDTVQH